jgi:electron transfer flavoprotein beta subunit
VAAVTDMPTVLVARQWVDRRARVDSLTGHVSTDPRTSGASDADDAALAVALRIGAAWDLSVVAATVGPPQTEAVLHEPLALGVAEAWRVESGGDDPDDADDVAVALAALARRTGAAVVVCGDMGLEAGTGAVPALVADELGVPQALGLVAIDDLGSSPGPIRVRRRLDGGRREVLECHPPCVLSVEGGTAPLARASLAGALAAQTTAVNVLDRRGAGSSHPLPPPVRVGPYRPRTHVVVPPEGPHPFERIVTLVGGAVPRTPPQVVTLDPDEAADRLLATLAQWRDET